VSDGVSAGNDPFWQEEFRAFEATLSDQKGKVVYKGKIEGPTKMKGEVEFTGLGSGTWSATKKD